MSEMIVYTKEEQLLSYIVKDMANAAVTTAVVTLTLTSPKGTVVLNAVAMAWNAATSQYEYTVSGDTFTPDGADPNQPLGANWKAIIEVKVAGVRKIYRTVPVTVLLDQRN